MSYIQPLSTPYVMEEQNMLHLPAGLKIATIAAFVWLILANGLAHNAQAEIMDATASSVPVYHRTYAGFEFMPSHSDLTFAPYGDGIYATTIPAGGQYFKKALDLPDGSEIKRIDLYVIDVSETYNMTAQLVAFAPASGGQDVIIALSTSALPASINIQTVSVTGNPIVILDNNGNQYYLRYQPVTPGNAHVLIGIHIEYTLTVRYLPSVVIQ
jgi:hypothetical protein